MSFRTSQRAVYLATAVIVAAMIGGFALAEIAIGQTNVSYQGSQTTTIASVPGLTYMSTQLVQLSANVVNTTCSVGSPCSVTTSGATDCAGGFTGSIGCMATHYVEQVTFDTDANTAFVGTVTLTLYVTGTPVGASHATTFPGTSFYYTQTSSSNAVYSIVIDFDIGTNDTGPGVVTTVSAIASD